jgi:hypothetical protein
VFTAVLHRFGGLLSEHRIPLVRALGAVAVERQQLAAFVPPVQEQAQQRNRHKEN